MPRELAQGLNRIFLRAEAPGMVAAIVDGERTYFLGLGVARAGSIAHPDETALLLINSLSKVMTG